MKDWDEFIIKIHIWDDTKERPPHFYDFIISKWKVINQSNEYTIEFKNTTSERTEKLFDWKYQLFDHLSWIWENDLQIALETVDVIISKNHKELFDKLNNK